MGGGLSIFTVVVPFRKILKQFFIVFWREEYTTRRTWTTVLFLQARMPLSVKLLAVTEAKGVPWQPSRMITATSGAVTWSSLTPTHVSQARFVRRMFFA